MRTRIISITQTHKTEDFFKVAPPCRQFIPAAQGLHSRILANPHPNQCLCYACWGLLERPQNDSKLLLPRLELHNLVSILLVTTRSNRRLLLLLLRYKDLYFVISTGTGSISNNGQQHKPANYNRQLGQV